jgi:autotransporter strand-loop-strand O-heptosyltransferase
MYKNLIKNENTIKEINPIKFICNYNEGAYLEIQSSIEKRFKVDFINGKGVLDYSTEIGSNMWCRTNKKYFEEYTCNVTDLETNKVVFVEKYNPVGKKVFITLESKSLGDTMAWFPYIDEFRKKWNCNVVCSTFHNKLFVDQYPDLEFISPGAIVHGVYATYRIGLFFDNGKIDYNKHKKDPTKISLLEMATDILGLEYSEVRPKLRPSNVEKKKRVGIGLHSTAQTKYWNNPIGWQEVTDFLISQGYEVVMLSKEADGYMGNFYPRGVVRLPEESFEDLIDNLYSCEFFIGISSGLSWLAWAVNIPVVLISGFTGEYMEPTNNVVRIINKSVCNDCWGRHKFDPGDWNWCPDYKGTPRQFECSKSITGRMVIDRLITSGTVLVNNIDEEEKRILSFFEKRYDIEYLDENILLKKKILR